MLACADSCAGEKDKTAAVLEEELSRLRKTLAHAQGEKASELVLVAQGLIHE
jgi:hypothetical protein